MNWPPKQYNTNIYINIDKITQKDKNKSAKIRAPAEGYEPYVLTINPDIYHKLYGANHICKAIIISKPLFITISLILILILKTTINPKVTF